MLDDFGVGFGSFHYLKHLPFDGVKIDGDFVHELATSATDQHTVRAIVTIANGLRKATTAEHVSDGVTLDLLRAMGVDRAQGYYVGRPQPAVAGEPRTAAVGR
jgi:EAL domain-containing protein (putative c-di-GMP-specific phosphodiesterase class I)